MLKGKKILLGITGSIAAYKTVALVRLLVKEEAEVRVVMTRSALNFVSPLVLSTLSKNAIISTFIDKQKQWNNHVDLGLWADLFWIVPCTANQLAKCASGICDNILSATYFSAKCPIYLAPAMDLDMYQHPVTQQNLQIVKKNGVQIQTSESGELASGLIGLGRMAEPEMILSTTKKHFTQSCELAGQVILITAGPTKEAIDPVRYIGNHSSGKMGFAIAEAAVCRGAEVILISGPVNETIKSDKVKKIDVISAQEMYNACKKYHQQSNICIFTAAVADFRPSKYSPKKIKAESELISISLKNNVDIARRLGKEKKKGQIHIGFALETSMNIASANKKRIEKSFDFIILNSINTLGFGFGLDTNKITYIFSKTKIIDVPIKTKKELGIHLVESIIPLVLSK